MLEVTTRKLAFGFLFVLIVNIVFFAVMIYAMKKTVETAIAQNNKTWCEALDLIHQGQVENPAQTEAGRNFARVIQRLRVKYGCEGD